MRKLAGVYARSRVPLYVQVASVMRQRIEAGRWAKGEKISTLEELEQEFSVARVTVRQAIELLRDEGLLDAQQGRGTFVSGDPGSNRWFNLALDLESTITSLRNNVLKRVHVEEDGGWPSVAESEGKLAEGYAFLRSAQYNGAQAFSVVNLYLAKDIYVRDKKRFTRTAALPMIFEMKDVTVTHAYQTITIGVADYETADLLHIGLGDPTCDCRLVLIDSAGVAIYVANIHYHKDCFAIRNDLLGRPDSPGSLPLKKTA